MKTSHQLPFSYGWVVLTLTVISMAQIYGIRHSFSVFFPPVLDEFGWSRGSTAFMLSLNILIYGMMAPLAGTLGDLWKPKLVVVLGVAILGLATASCAWSDELWHFYILFGILVPVGTALSGWPLLSPALANWFQRKRGLAMGMGQMGGGLSFVYGLFAALVISKVGWRDAYLVLGGVLAALLLPAHFLLFRYRPEQQRQASHALPGSVSDSKANMTVPQTENPRISDWTLGRAMRTPQLWFLVLANFFYWGIGCYIVLGHVVRFAVDVGYSNTLAASVFAVFGIAMMGGQFSAGMSDWIGREKTFLLGTTLGVGGLVALLLVRDTTQPVLLFAHAVCFGLGAGLVTPTIFVGAADLFHGRHFGSISGFVLTGMGIGAAIGPWLGGYLYDVSGSYTVPFAISMLCIVAACASFLTAAPRRAIRGHPIGEQATLE